MATRIDSRELGNFTHFEHVNYGFPITTLPPCFYRRAGLTRDPMRMVSVRNIIGKQRQTAVSSALGEVFKPGLPAEIGLTVRVWQLPCRRKRIFLALKDTEFDCQEDGKTLLTHSRPGTLHPVCTKRGTERVLQERAAVCDFLGLPVGTAADPSIGAFIRMVDVPAGAGKWPVA